ncbi:histidine--tRNA ligase [Rhodothalassium salexigens]|uniref:histidine--tRNA ligase n=1 Tax=Rhodothalassium salexigens TaxID=1086 RepID=UPI001914016F|nr:histidine--tRNA ligase [Rhodothalassium salexigens]MBK5911420.1 histidine--tRNA ligase [Rhodothalassium salexigens]MBK5920683.1 histidine--tRNA ligase [Rhodothalassium salexigens]
MSKLQPVRGTRDIFGEDARRMAHVRRTFARVAETYGFDEIATPVFEFTEVFKRTLGDTSDVVTKEMYTFEDRSGDEITLRPEMTAGVARAYLSNGMAAQGTVRLYGNGPMFRHERPQKGRYRQFHQIDAEIIGDPSPQADIELLAMAWQLLTELGLAQATVLHVNTLGDPESRQSYRAALVDYFSQHKDRLSDDSRTRLERNPLRILDSKDAGDRALVEDAPRFADHLTPAAVAFFDTVCAGLDRLGIPYTYDQRLVRGLDYYAHTAFEFITTALGAQGTVLAGGRYDGLIEQMGGPSTPGVGWAAGIERLGLLLDQVPESARPVFLIPMGEPAADHAQVIARDLRARGIRLEADYRGNLKKRLNRANRRAARWAVILGDDELAEGAASLRDLDSGEQRRVALDDLAAVLLADAAGQTGH